MSGLRSSQQSYSNGCRAGSACIRRQTKDDSYVLGSNFDSLHKSSNYLSPAVPIGTREVGPDDRREFAKPLRCQSHVLQLVDITGECLNLSTKLSDTAF